MWREVERRMLTLPCGHVIEDFVPTKEKYTVTCRECGRQWVKTPKGFRCKPAEGKKAEGHTWRETPKKRGKQ